MISALSPESVAELRACAEKYGVEAVLAEARRRRQKFTDTRLTLQDRNSLDALKILSAADEFSGLGVEKQLPPELVVQPPQLKALLSEERQRWVNRAVRQLPLPEKRVIRLRYWDDLPLKTIGAMMGYTAQRADQVHRQALGRLRRWIYFHWFMQEAM